MRASSVKFKRLSKSVSTSLKENKPDCSPYGTVSLSVT